MVLHSRPSIAARVRVWAFLLWFATAGEVFAQFNELHGYMSSGELLQVGVRDGTGWYVYRGELVSIRFADWKVTHRPIDLPLDRFEPNAKPGSATSGIQPDGRYAWLMDGSVGPSIRVGLGADTSVVFLDHWSTQNQHGLAEGFNPVSQKPLAYGGYGFYRVHDYLLQFEPDALRWLEVPNRGERHPPARFTAKLAEGWHPTRVAMVGGFGAQPGTSPPVNEVRMMDAWLYDFADSTWTEVPITLEALCGVDDTHRMTGSLFPDARTESVFLHRPHNCNGLTSPTDAVLQWFPQTGEVATVATFNQEAINEYAALAAIYREPGTDSVTVVHWTPKAGEPVEEWRHWIHRYPVPPAPRSEPGLPLSMIALFFGLVLAGAIGLAGWRRAGRAPGVVEVQGNGNGSTAELRRGRTVVRPALPQAASQLIGHLAERQPKAGEVIDADDLQRMFDADYPDPDSARTIKNRAIEDLNEAFREHFASPLLERVRRVDDARRFDYRVLVGLRKG